MKLMTLIQAEEKYGKIVNGVWAREAEFCMLLEVPADIAEKLINKATGKPTTHIYCNKDIAQELSKALCNVRDRGLLHELRTFGGCFMIRSIRGMSSVVSTHSYALAVDLNPDENPLGGPVQFSEEFGACFVDVGFLWGARFSRKDGMHFQLAAW